MLDTHIAETPSTFVCEFLFGLVIYTHEIKMFDNLTSNQRTTFLQVLQIRIFIITIIPLHDLYIFKYFNLLTIIFVKHLFRYILN